MKHDHRQSIWLIAGGQLDMPPEIFKAFVVMQLDRLMLVDAKPEGTA